MNPTPGRHDRRAGSARPSSRRFAVSIVLTLALGTGLGSAVLGMVRSGLAREAFCIDPFLCGGSDAAPDFISRWTAERQLLPEVQADSLRTLLWIACGLSLLLVGTTLVNLMVQVAARAAARRPEMAMRAALGASPWRLARRLLGEGSRLILAGTGLGIALGVVGAVLLGASWPLGDAPWGDLPLGGIIVAAVVGGLGLAVLFAWLSPAAVAWSRDLRRYLITGGRATVGPGEILLRDALAVTQIAAAVVVLASAGLLLRSFAASTAAESTGGIAAGGMFAAQVSLSSAAVADREGRLRYYEELLERVRAVPGVVDSSLATDGAWVGLGVIDRVTALCPECYIGTLPKQMASGPARLHVVSPGFFDSLGLAILEGRDFQTEDRSDAAAVAVINNAFAIRLFPNGEPLGKEVRIGGRGGDWYRVVGVVDDVHAEGLGSGAMPVPALYLSLYQHPPSAAGLAVRTTGDPMRLAAAVEGLVEGVAPGAEMRNAITLEDLLERYGAPLRWFAVLFGVLATAVLIFATSGLYGVVAFSVARRRREIGIRMALGAQGGAVVRMILGQALGLVGVGVVVGLIPLSGLARLLQVMFLGVELWEPVLYGGIGILLAVVTLLAASGPARVAAAVQPQVALREE